MSKYYDSQGNVVESHMTTQIQRALAFSATTPLGAGGVYTSPTIDGINYKQYTGIVTSDQAGSYFLQVSEDGITWTNTTGAAAALTANAITLLNGTNFHLRYFRVVFTNGATLQGMFKFIVYLSPL